MKTFVGDDALSLLQARINALPEHAVVALAYNEDTCRLDFGTRKVIEVCDAGGLIASKFRFDMLIEDYNEEPLDFCVLGIGLKGQIGFNEVATPFDSHTHRQKLTETTKNEYSFLGSMPDYGLTMGIKTICNSKEIAVLALGEKRADAVFGMPYGRADSTIPAAFLQVPVNVEVYADTAAASKL